MPLDILFDLTELPYQIVEDMLVWGIVEASALLAISGFVLLMLWAYYSKIIEHFDEIGTLFIATILMVCVISSIIAALDIIQITATPKAYIMEKLLQ